MATKLTATQKLIVQRVTLDRIGGTQFDHPVDVYRKAFAFTAWELFRV